MSFVFCFLGVLELLYWQRCARQSNADLSYSPMFNLPVSCQRKIDRLLHFNGPTLNLKSKSARCLPLRKTQGDRSVLDSRKKDLLLDRFSSAAIMWKYCVLHPHHGHL